MRNKLSIGIACISFLMGASALGMNLQPNRYVLLNEGEEVLDTHTRLIWKRCAAGMSLKLNQCTGKPLFGSTPITESSGNTTWRLPTQAELLTLVLTPNPEGKPDSPVVDTAAFPDTPRVPFKAGGTRGDVMETVSFLTGNPNHSRPLASSAFRFVRESSSARSTQHPTTSSIAP